MISLIAIQQMIPRNCTHTSPVPDPGGHDSMPRHLRGGLLFFHLEKKSLTNEICREVLVQPTSSVARASGSMKALADM